MSIVLEQGIRRWWRDAASAFLVLMAALAGSRANAEVFNIEIDYMVDSGIGGHSHRPSNHEIDAVVQMFACQGHTLNIIVDDVLPHYTQLRNDPNNCRNVFGYSGANGSFGRLKRDFYDHAGEAGWHYCIFAHFIEDAECKFSGSSGIAEIGGDDFIVSLGDFDNDIGTPWDRAATLAHEFGHNLGLYHCGGAAPCGDPDDDPTSIGPRPVNLPSVMSYFYQLRGVRANLECQGLVHPGLTLFKNLDYSHGSMCTLNEAFLDELYGSGLRSVDWDCGGTIGGVVSQDLNEDADGWCGAVTGLHTLRDFDEWANIRDHTRVEHALLSDLPVSRCVTSSEVRAQQVKRGGCPQPAVVVEACFPGEMVYATGSGMPGAVGTCDDPFPTVEAAKNAAPAGSILQLTPRVYRERVPLILQTQVTISSRGTAVIGTTIP